MSGLKIMLPMAAVILGIFAVILVILVATGGGGGGRITPGATQTAARPATAPGSPTPNAIAGWLDSRSDVVEGALVQRAGVASVDGQATH